MVFRTYRFVRCPINESPATHPYVSPREGLGYLNTALRPPMHARWRQVHATFVPSPSATLRQSRAFALSATPEKLAGGGSTTADYVMDIVSEPSQNNGEKSYVRLLSSLECKGLATYPPPKTPVISDFVCLTPPGRHRMRSATQQRPVRLLPSIS